mmetsp:Transcript_8076/g.17484  ORF Transcript_8076/g.17484 Transcript_8076/m.17484 type:complete len:108 (-) Transcript_8076:442-765(-)
MIWLLVLASAAISLAVYLSHIDDDCGGDSSNGAGGGGGTTGVLSLASSAHASSQSKAVRLEAWVDLLPALVRHYSLCCHMGSGDRENSAKQGLEVSPSSGSSCIDID